MARPRVTRRYYKAEVRYGNETYPIYLNVGNAKNKTGYHIFDITRKIRGTAKHNALERVKNDLRSEINPLDNRIPQDIENVKGYTQYSLDLPDESAAERGYLAAERDIREQEQKIKSRSSYLRY